jgi:DNA-binding beta-propeller fold protein YncE
MRVHRPFTSSRCLSSSLSAGLLIAVVALLAPATLADDQPAQAGDVLLQFPAPGPSPQGLAWDGQHLWIADDTTQKLYQLQPADGKVLASLAAPGAQPRGLVWDGANLRVADNAAHKVYTIAHDTGRVMATINAPVAVGRRQTAELGGVAWDGKHLWIGTIAGWSSRMNQVDPASGAVTRFYFSKGYPRALATDGESLYSASESVNERLGIIYKYQLSDGAFVSQRDAPGLQTAGLAYDGHDLWCVDHQTKLIYKLADKWEDIP